MSSWKVKLAHGTNQEAQIDLIDTVGPVNEWRAHPKGAFLPEEGHFTNQAKRVVSTDKTSFVLNQFDIDEVEIGSSGLGEVFHSGGSFPPGPVRWTVVGPL